MKDSVKTRGYYEILIAVLASILVFPKPATIAILIFVVVSLFYYHNIKWTRVAIWSIVIIALPFVLDLIFLWNNDVLGEGLKHMEKRLSMAVFPILILSQRQDFNLLRILKIYSTIFTILLTVLFARYAIVESALFYKYLNGIHLWEMGYAFANSMGLHAPAVNMHVAFLVLVHTYLIACCWKRMTLRLRILRIILWCISVFMLLYLNTRIAVGIALVGILVIIFLELSRQVNIRSLIISTSIAALLLIFIVFAFAKANPYMLEKYTTKTFKNIDMVGRLDEFDDPEGEVFTSFVTRLSIWKTAWDRAQDNLWIGVGAADGKKELSQAYVDTNQAFLAKYKFPTHNQYLDFLLKFGILGLFAVVIYMFHILWLALKLKNSLVFMFFILFLVSNLTDDFLIRFDGIAFSALWISIFASQYWKDRADTNLLTA
ncbi:O-antigen ligase family protein [Nonlabens marinus]|uniref:O-antigen ligase family protein n=1 Tax=Nonlabens marinus TaxID=930802 RepID=UPI000695F3D8|nr:O-antigen ligase family protein [Nonlabens marinus]